MDVFPVDWRATERETSFEITCYGKLRDGRSVCMRVPFFPYFFVECPAGWQATRAKVFIAEAVATLGAVPKYSLPVTRKSIWGFTNNEPRTFAQLAFFTLAAFRRARRAITDRHKMKTYEASVDQVLRLFHVRDLAPAQWIRAAAWKEVVDRVAVTDLEVMVDFTALSPLVVDDIPCVVFASWDLECYSASGAFPLAERQGDVICTIGTTFQRYGEPEPYLRQAITLGGCDPLDGVEVVACETEAELINAWLATLRREKVDVLCGWNTFQFDYKYLYGRSLVCVDDLTGEPLVEMGRLGNAVEGGGVPVQKNLSSAAYGDNAFFSLASPGVLNLDLMQSIKREHKFDSYSLNAVSAKILGDTKIDLKPAEIFAKFRGSDADRALIAEYCIKDTLLPLQLMAKLSVFQNMVEMANATTVPLHYLVERGQQIKVFSLIVRKARSLGYVCPDMDRGAAAADAEKYEGATVLDAQKGAYLEDVVSALDFASLYPSIIRAHNLCPSTLVMDRSYASLPGVEYYTIGTPLGVFSYAQGVPSVVPALLSDLALFRTDAKKHMAIAKAAGDSFRASVENSKQLAYKVSMNSAYGFFGAQKGGFLPCVPLAVSVTSTGRQMIATTKAMVETLVPGSRVVYGDTDSVMCIFNCGPDNRTNLRAHFAMAQRVAAQITDSFKKPNELEFEKCYYPYLLFSKKRYAGMLYTTPAAPDYMDVKGLQLVRRDNAPIVKTVSSAILHSIMHDTSRNLAIDVAKRHILMLLTNQHALEAYITSKALRSEYKNPDSQPHLQVAKKIHARRGYPVPSGERVPYVFIESKDAPDGLQAQRAEDPAYVAEHGLVIDRLHYLDSQLAGPIETLLDVLESGTFAELMASPDIKPLVDELRAARTQAVATARRVRTNTANKQREITSYFIR